MLTINEDIADIYSKEFNLGIIGLRFFTVYGPFGRPDMAYLNLTKIYLMICRSCL